MAPPSTLQLGYLTQTVYTSNVSFCAVNFRDQSLPLHFCKAAPLRVNIGLQVWFAAISVQMSDMWEFTYAGISACLPEFTRACVRVCAADGIPVIISVFAEHRFMHFIYMRCICRVITSSAARDLFWLSTWAPPNNANCCRTKTADDNSFRNCHVVYKYLATGLHCRCSPGLQMKR